MPIKLRLLVKIQKLTLKMPKENTYFYWIEVDQWRETKYKKQRKPYAFSLKVYLFKATLMSQVLEVCIAIKKCFLQVFNIQTKM